MIQDKYDEKVGAVKVREGHMLLTDVTTDVLKEIIDMTQVKKVFEIGFNAGHSAFGFLSIDPDVHYHSIDIGRYRYTKDCADTIKSLFGERFKFGIKDSLTVTPDNLESENYDMVYIDGDHRFASFRKDFQLCVDVGVEYILIDDITLFGSIREFVESLDGSDRHPYSVVKYFDFDNDVLRRDPLAAPEWKITRAALLKRDRK